MNDRLLTVPEIGELVSGRCRHCGRRIETDYVDRHLWWHSSDMTVHCDADRMEESTLAEPEDWER